MAEYRISVEGSEATASIPNGPGALRAAECIARGFALAYPGQVVTAEKREAAERPWRTEGRWRGEEVARIEPRNIGRTPR